VVVRPASLAALLLATGCAAAAADGPITPANLAARLEAAKGGETIKLPAGDYGVVTFPKRSFSPGLKINAAQARFKGIVLHNVSGVSISGGTITGPPKTNEPDGKSYGIAMRYASKIRIEVMTISGAHRGVVVGESKDIALIGNRLTGLISDGIDIALSARVRVERNSCRDFSPRPAIYDRKGQMVKDGDHPDCIQAWSRPTAPPTSDLVIIGNDIEGRMQGIFLGNHVRNGVDDGGFDRVIVRDNRVRVGVGNGIVGGNTRDSIFVGNTVRSIEGSQLPNRPGHRVKANMRVTGLRNIVCDNMIADVPIAEGNRSCSKAERQAAGAAKQ
jgi:Right handed beta helix region